jgi:hypothetical protein
VRRPVLAALLVLTGALGVTACADDGREMKPPTFPPPTPTTSTTVAAELSVGS